MADTCFYTIQRVMGDYPPFRWFVPDGWSTEARRRHLMEVGYNKWCKKAEQHANEVDLLTKEIAALEEAAKAEFSRNGRRDWKRSPRAAHINGLLQRIAGAKESLSKNQSSRNHYLEKIRIYYSERLDLSNYKVAQAEILARKKAGNIESKRLAAYNEMQLKKLEEEAKHAPAKLAEVMRASVKGEKLKMDREALQTLITETADTTGGVGEALDLYANALLEEMEEGEAEGGGGGAGGEGGTEPHLSPDRVAVPPSAPLG